MQFDQLKDARAFFEPRRHLAITLAVRAALRVFPALWLASLRGCDDFETDYILPTVHKLGVSWAAGLYVPIATTLLAEIDAVEWLDIAVKTGDGQAVCTAKTALATAAGHPNRMIEDEGLLVPLAAAFTVCRAATAVRMIAAHPAVAFRPFNKAIWHDVARLDNHKGHANVLASALWPDEGAPPELRVLWHDLKNAFTQSRNVPAWITWYDDRLNGVTRARDEAHMTVWLQAVLRAEEERKRNRPRDDDDA